MATTATPPALEPRASVADPDQRPRLRSITASPAFQGSVTFVAFVAVFAAFGVWLGDQFLDVEARFLDVHQTVPVLILALAVLVTLIAGQFDLSVASMATLTSFLSVGLSINQGWPFAIVLLACLAIGLVGGLINGLLVMRLGVNTFIATLATGGIFLGLSKVYSKGVTQTPGNDNALPEWFAGPNSLGSFANKAPSAIVWVLLAIALAGLWARVRRARPAALDQRSWDAICAGAIALAVVVLLVVADLDTMASSFSWTMIVLLAAAVLMWALLGYTTLGRYLHATGYNPEAARLTGVNTSKETIKAFVIGGVLAAVAGVMLSANQGSAAPDAAATFLLPAFAAAFLSTVVLSTGRFTVWGAVVGGIFLVWVSQGLIVGGLAFTWTDVVNGVVLASAVALSTVLRRRRP